MSTLVTPLSDGGRVETTWVSGGKVTLQKFDAQGQAVGEAYATQENYNVEPQVVALSNGGYAMLTGFVFKGGYYNAFVFDEDGASVSTFRVPPGSGIGAEIAASPDGGFMVIAMEYHYYGYSNAVDYSWRPHLTMYDNDGGVVRGPVGLTGDMPTITVDSEGHYLVSWQDGNISHSLDIDPTNPPSFEQPATPTFQVIDDQGERTGVVDGSYVNDLTPIFRVAVSETGWVEVSHEVASPGVENQVEGGVRVTEADVARGYIDIPTDGKVAEGAPYKFFVRFKDDMGVVSESSSKGLNLFNNVDLWRVTEDDGDVVGNGGTTTDSTPTVRIGLETSGKHEGDVITLSDGNQTVGQATLTAADVARGYVDVTTSFLPDGEHILRAWSNPAPGYTINVAASPAAPGDHQAVLQDWNGTPTEGGRLAIVSGQEGFLPGGSYAGQGSLTTTHYFYVAAPDGVKTLDVGGRTVIADGAFTPTSFNYVPDAEHREGVGTLAVTGYDEATGKVTVSFTTTTVFQHAPGESGHTFDVGVALTDTDGDTTGGTLAVVLYDDGGRAAADTASATSGGPTVSGNLFANDASADGGLALYSLGGAAGAGPLTLAGARGTLTVQANGDYVYTPNAGASAGADGFDYGVKDADGDVFGARLTVTVGENTSGQHIVSDRYGDSMVGGAGDDTLEAGQGPDVMTGGAGADAFVFGQVPWNAGHVTDFQVGADRIDLSALLAASGYSGSDAQADGYIRIEGSANATTVYFDPDGPASGNPWPMKIVTLDNVSANGLNWSQLADPTGPQPEPGTDHTPTITAVGGGSPGVFRVYESGLVNGSAPDPSKVNIDASLMLNAEDGVKDLYMGSQLIISNGAFTPTSYTDTSVPFTVIFRSFNAATGQLDVTFRLNQAMKIGAGPDGVHTAWGLSLYDQDGDNVRASFETVIYDDAAAPVNDADVIANNAATPVTGNILTDASSGDQGDGDNGADRMGADGAVLYGMMAPGIAGFSGNFGPSASLTGRYGTITLSTNGDYSYVLNGAAPAGVTETFVYTLRDGDGDDTTASLQINIVAPDSVPDPGSTQGATLTSSRYGDTLVAGQGDDTLIAGRGPDVLTGGGGDDVFRFNETPWNAGHITDFQAGDALDLSGLFRASGYAGSDPVADGFVRFENDGDGYAQVFYDTDGAASGNTIWFKVTTLDHISAGGLTWAQLTSGGASGGGGEEEPPPPPPSGPGQTITSDQYGDTLVGTAGDDTLVAGQGPDQMTGAGGADRFVWRDLPWNAGHVTDFTPGTDQLDLRPLFQAWGYSGTDPVADGRLAFGDDGAGNTQVYFDRDDPNGGDWPFLITTLDGVSPGQVRPGDWLF